MAARKAAAAVPLVQRAASIVGRPVKPGFVEMVNPDLVSKPPSGPKWAHEIKWDGYRAQAHLKGKRAQMFTRQGNDWTGKFGPISEALPKLRVDNAILDGEVVSIGRNGLSDFHGLRHQLGTMLPQIVYQAFDLLWLDGEDLRPLPYVERKARLKDLLRRGGEMIRYIDHIEGNGAGMLKAACRMELEGIVSKRLDSAYRPGRSHDWQKTKCEVSETFAVAGYGVDDNGRIDGILLGQVDGESLRYAGTVDRGLGADDLAELEQRLPPLKVGRCPLSEKPQGKSGVRWTRPEVLVEVSYPNKSGDGRLRHPSFKGFRDDIIANAARGR